MKVKDWPKDGSPAVFEDLNNAVRDVVRHCYTIRRKNKDKDVAWKGPEFPECMRATCIPFDLALQADNLKYSQEDQGRSAMDVIIDIAIQLGIEQGRRMYKSELKHNVNRLEMAADMVRSAMFNLMDKA